MKQSNGKVKSEKLWKPQKKLTEQLNFTQRQQAEQFPSETCAIDKIVQFKLACAGMIWAVSKKKKRDLNNRKHVSVSSRQARY